MKTRTKKDNGMLVLLSAQSMVAASLKTATGGERVRLEAELAGIEQRMTKLAA